MPKLNEAHYDDLSKIALLHKEVYPGTHFTSHLPDHVLQTYYSYFLSGSTVTFKAVDMLNGEPSLCGFLTCGTGIPEAIALFKQKQRLALLIAALRHPVAVIRKLGSATFYGTLDSPTQFKPAPYLILSIASNGRVKGIGKLLLEAAKNRAAILGYSRIGLYVHCHNLHAIKFYLRNQFLITGYTSGQFYLEAPTE